MDKKQIVNELVDYNLLLLRTIYDAYEERADKVIKNFRTDNHNTLRKRYMVPIVNPNYDYDALMNELKQKNKPMDNIDEESVHLDAETVCEDEDRQAMEALMDEGHEDLN